MLRQRRLSSRDAALATELVQGTLRHRGTYDAIIGALSNQSLESLDPPVLEVLRLGMHQILTMRIPVHAAVTTSVDLVRSRVGHKPSGLVNAILRRAAERTAREWIASLTADMSVLAAHAIAYSHPEWVITALSESLEPEAEPLEALLERNNEAPPVTLVARPGLCEIHELPGIPGSISPYAMRLESGDPAGIDAVREARAGVQDEASQAVAVALASAPVASKDVGPPDETWLDLCAGPGGKAALLGALAVQSGASLEANDPQSHRASLVRQAVRLLPDVTVTEYDGRAGPWPAGTFDRVLLDAPCSGLGALRRRPEARWHRSPDDMDTLVSLQRQLLERAIELTRSGGVIGYATCSPHWAETTQIVRAAEGVDVADVRRWWPHIHDTDAMYLALLRRR